MMNNKRSEGQFRANPICGCGYDLEKPCEYERVIGCFEYNTLRNVIVKYIGDKPTNERCSIHKQIFECPKFTRKLAKAIKKQKKDPKTITNEYDACKILYHQIKIDFLKQKLEQEDKKKEINIKKIRHIKRANVYDFEYFEKKWTPPNVPENYGSLFKELSNTKGIDIESLDIKKEDHPSIDFFFLKGDNKYYNLYYGLSLFDRSRVLSFFITEENFPSTSVLLTLKGFRKSLYSPYRFIIMDKDKNISAIFSYERSRKIEDFFDEEGNLIKDSSTLMTKHTFLVREF